ncbi:MAG: GNAT family N-acetyltransferase [Halobacteriales archaeon]
MSLRYRDAREDDADKVAEIANCYFLPQDMSVGSMRDLVQDRTMKVAVDGENEEEDGGDIVGYVSYRVVDDTVVVQHVCVVPEYRDTEVPARLVSFPADFADDEGLRTRVAVGEDSWFCDFLPKEGFEEQGKARFAGETLRMFER